MARRRSSRAAARRLAASFSRPSRDSRAALLESSSTARSRAAAHSLRACACVIVPASLVIEPSATSDEEGKLLGNVPSLWSSLPKSLAKGHVMAERLSSEGRACAAPGEQLAEHRAPAARDAAASAFPAHALSRWPVSMSEQPSGSRAHIPDQYWPRLPRATG